eukprot:jgi/Botrbrau1/3825/Bobra.0183s0054.2
MLSPNGRFETGIKICLSISSHHPEHWQPSWSVRTALTALIAFMPTPGGGAIGSLDYTKNERAVLALRSRAEPPQFGNIERQQLINDMHQRVLAAGAQEVSAKPLVQEETPAVAAVDKPEFGTLDDAGSQPRDLARQVAVSEMPPSQPVARASHPAVPSDVADRRESSILAGTPERMQDRLGAPPPYMGQTIGGTVHAAQPGQLGTQGAGIQVSAAGAYTQQHNSWEDTTLTFLATTLTVIIIAILFRRLLRVTGTDLWAIL